jgi:peroxiredoxin
MNLSQQIQKLQKKMAEEMPSEAVDKMYSTIDSLSKTDAGKKALKKGDIIPPFALLSQDLERVSSGELLEKGPLVISFFRGNWCPFCSLESDALNSIYPEIKKAGAELIAISPQTPEKSFEMKKTKGLLYNILFDDDNKLAKKFGLAYKLFQGLIDMYKEFNINIPEYNSKASWELPIPATYVIYKNKIVLSYADTDYTKRLEPAKILDALKKLK